MIRFSPRRVRESPTSDRRWADLLEWPGQVLNRPGHHSPPSADRCGCRASMRTPTLTPHDARAAPCLAERPTSTRRWHRPVGFVGSHESPSRASRARPGRESPRTSQQQSDLPPASQPYSDTDQDQPCPTPVPCRDRRVYPPRVADNDAGLKTAQVSSTTSLGLRK